jgi:hypothetical protein
MSFLLLNCLLHVGFVYFARAPKNCTTMVLLALLQIKDSAMLFVLLLNYKGLTEALSLTSEKLIVDLKVVELKAQLFGVFRWVLAYCSCWLLSSVRAGSSSSSSVVLM